MSSPADGFVVGVDIGGTKVAAGLVDPDGKIVVRARTPMIANDSAASGLSAVISAIDSVSKTSNDSGAPSRLIQGIGICSPGPLDPRTGVVLNPPNVPCWRNFPLAAEVAGIYGVPVTIDNDANAAGLAESLWGAGRGYHNVFFATIGTGIGTAIVFDGRVYHGRTGAAAEGGHISIDYRGPRCACGKPGCIETLASGPAIARRVRERLEAGKTSSILDLAGGQAKAITSEMVGEAYSSGDAVAREVLGETIEMLALWLGNVIDFLEPDVIIIGGGVATILRPFFPEIQNRLPGCCVNSRCQEIPIVPAQYGEDAGIAGGAALCFKANTKISGVASAETFATS
ncbi:MAG TPA: ROK family protein [Terriglobales bacterium]|nr:ROK family protein [Terriglobales bacterium]